MDPHRFRQPSPSILLEGVRTGAAVRGKADPLRLNEGLAISRTNANDIRCVPSWILRNITDREALDAAIRLAGTVQWFASGSDVEPPFDVIYSTFESCFDSSREVYPESMDRASHSARALLQIWVFGKCRSPGFTRKRLPPQLGECRKELGQEFAAIVWGLFDGNSYDHEALFPTFGLARLQWSSNLFLWLAWTKQRTGGTFDSKFNSIEFEFKRWDELPPTIVVDRLLTWCIRLGRHIDESVLLIEDKSCVPFHPFPLKMHISTFLVFICRQFYLNYPAQS